MALYLIAFNDEWVPDLTLEQLRAAGRAGRGVCDEMTAAGVFVVSDGALDALDGGLECGPEQRHAAVHGRPVRGDQGASSGR